MTLPTRFPRRGELHKKEERVGLYALINGSPNVGRLSILIKKVRAPGKKRAPLSIGERGSFSGLIGLAPSCGI